MTMPENWPIFLWDLLRIVQSLGGDSKIAPHERDTPKLIRNGMHCPLNGGITSLRQVGESSTGDKQLGIKNLEPSKVKGFVLR